MAKHTPDTVAVVGGGAVGTTLAGDLATRGVDVTLFERDTIASGSSGRAAGLCYDAYADRRDVELAQRALDRFRTLDVPFESCPYVILGRDADTAAAIEDLAEQMDSRGVDVDLCDGVGLAEQFPALVTEDAHVAAVVHNAGVLDARAYTEAMAERAREMGASVRTETEVTLTGTATVEADGHSQAFDSVVVAAGPATKPLLAGVDVDLPLSCYRAQVLTTDTLDPADRPNVMLFDATDHYYLRPWDDGVLLGDGVDADVDPRDWNERADPDFLDAGRPRLQASLGVDPTVEESWAGLCTATPDRDPLVGAVADGLYVATGWYGHGLMRAPAVAEALAAQVCGAAGIAGFDPARFDGSESVDISEQLGIE